MRKIICLLLMLSAIQVYAQNNRAFYFIKLYHFNEANQQKSTEAYLQQAWLPAVNKKGIKQVGFFTPIGNDTAAQKKLYVLIPLSSLNDLYQIDDALLKDQEYLKAAAPYLNAAYNQPTYNRIETFVLRAFTDMPKIEKPVLSGPVQERIYELRSYEGATEKIIP